MVVSAIAIVTPHAICQRRRTLQVPAHATPYNGPHMQMTSPLNGAVLFRVAPLFTPTLNTFPTMLNETIPVRVSSHTPSNQLQHSHSPHCRQPFPFSRPHRWHRVLGCQQLDRWDLLRPTIILPMMCTAARGPSASLSHRRHWRVCRLW